MTLETLGQTAQSEEAVLKGLICPDCRQPLVKRNDALHCGKCQANFPVNEGIPCFVNLDPNALPFREEYFEFWFNRENSHFWHVGRKETIYRFVEPYLKERFSDFGQIEAIEIGIGNGNVATEFVRHGVTMQGADLFYSSLQFCRKRLQSPLYQADLLKLPFKNKFDFVGIYDIIEHIEDDRLSLKNLYESLKPGGLLNITVPACKFLWSAFDDIQHVRRYTLRELYEKASEAGFKVRRISYFMFFLFPVVYLVRKTQKYPKDTKLEKVNEVKIIPFVNELFLYIFRLEKFFIRRFNFPIGSSLILVAEKP